MVTKEEILNEIKNKNDEIQLEYLEKLLKKETNPLTRKNAFIIMGDIFIKRLLWMTAAKAYLDAADSAVSELDKKELFFKSGELYIKAGDLFGAEEAFRKCLVNTQRRDIGTVQDKIIEIHVSIAKEFESKRNSTKAIEVYKRILGLNLASEKANEVKDHLAKLYDRIGKPFDADKLREQKISKEEIDAEKKRKQQAVSADNILRDLGL